MKGSKRKDSLTFKREKPLANEERIYLLYLLWPPLGGDDIAFYVVALAPIPATSRPDLTPPHQWMAPVNQAP
jgi:hypothetical protein